MLVERIAPLDVAGRPLAEVHDFAPVDEGERRALEQLRGHDDGAEVQRRAVAGAGDFRAVAPSVMSFGRGRSR